MEERRDLKKIRILRPIIVAGKHADVGEVHAVPRGKAADIISSGCAEAEEPEPAPTSVRVDKPDHHDPQPESREPAISKRKREIGQ